MKNLEERTNTARKLLNIVKNQMWDLKTLQSGDVMDTKCFHYMLNHDEFIGRRYDDLLYRKELIQKFLFKNEKY